MTTTRPYAKVQIIATSLLLLSMGLFACNGRDHSRTPKLPEKKEQPAPNPEKKKPTPNPEKEKPAPKFLVRSIGTSPYQGIFITTTYTYDTDKRITSIKLSSDTPGDPPTEKTFSYSDKVVTIKNYEAPGKLDTQNFFEGVIANDFVFISEKRHYKDGKKEEWIYDPSSLKTDKKGRIISFDIKDTYSRKGSDGRAKDYEVYHIDLNRITITWTEENITAIKVEEGQVGQPLKVLMTLDMKYSKLINHTNISFIELTANDGHGYLLTLMNHLPFNVLQPQNLPSEIVRKVHKSSGVDTATFHLEYTMDKSQERPTGFKMVKNNEKPNDFTIGY